MELFDYVMQTPQNTNPAVLSSEINKAIEESQVQADYGQNDPTAKDYIKNRLIWEEVSVLDGNENLESYKGYSSATPPSDFGIIELKLSADLLSIAPQLYVLYSNANLKGHELLRFESVFDGDNYSDWVQGKREKHWTYNSSSHRLILDSKYFMGTYVNLYPFLSHVVYSIGVTNGKGTIYNNQLPTATYDNVGAVKAGLIGTTDTSRYNQVSIGDDDFLYAERQIIAIPGFDKNILSMIPKIDYGLGVIMAEGTASSLIEEKLGEPLTYPIFMGYTDYTQGSGAPWVTLIGFTTMMQSFSFRYHYFPYDIEDIEVNTLANHKNPYLTLKSPNGTSFKITVDDSGTLSATEITETT